MGHHALYLECPNSDHVHSPNLFALLDRATRAAMSWLITTSVRLVHHNFVASLPGFPHQHARCPVLYSPPAVGCCPPRLAHNSNKFDTPSASLYYILQYHCSVDLGPVAPCPSQGRLLSYRWLLAARLCGLHIRCHPTCRRERIIRTKRVPRRTTFHAFHSGHVDPREPVDPPYS
ncbi:hypothetical protein BGY98DRAFT_106380 [Russula aff. rugulosa BPL654]|nr:hypothetical protein BGY98DRAFT_106380 [Russula aff. rugulosa BPL654]